MNTEQSDSCYAVNVVKMKPKISVWSAKVFIFVLKFTIIDESLPSKYAVVFFSVWKIISQHIYTYIKINTVIVATNLISNGVQCFFFWKSKNSCQLTKKWNVNSINLSNKILRLRFHSYQLCVVYMSTSVVQCSIIRNVFNSNDNLQTIK